MSFRLAIHVFVSSTMNPFNFVNAHSLHQRVRCKEHTLTKLNGLLLTIMASRNDIHSCIVSVEKEKCGTSTLSHKMCPRKQTTEPKSLILETLLSGDTSSTDTSYCI